MGDTQMIITSNNEKELPDAFLRRCFFHFIKFPDRETMIRIINVHHPDLHESLLKESLEVFFQFPEIQGLKKKPSTSELIDWIKLLMVENIPADYLSKVDLSKELPPLYGAMLKNEQDVQAFERLRFMQRRM